MSMLDQREKALEEAFAHDEEVLFLMLSQGISYSAVGQPV